MATTHKLISTINVGSGGATYLEFTSIPSNYTDLKVLVSGRSNASDPSSYVQFNGSGGTAYKNLTLAGTGTSGSWTYSFALTGSAFNRFDSTGTGTADTTSSFSNIEIYIPNYATSNKKAFNYDSSRERNSTNYNYSNAIGGGFWDSTSTISSIIIDFDGDLVQYTNAYLYGISKS